MWRKHQTGRSKTRFSKPARFSWQRVLKSVRHGLAYVWRSAKKATKPDWLSLLKAANLIVEIAQKIRTLITYKQPQIVCLLG